MISSSMFRRFFPSASFDRGESYYHQGLVADLESNIGKDGALRVTASVQGSRSSPYHQEIRLILRGDSPTLVSGICDCPVGRNCKHVVAAVLAWAAAGDLPATRPAASPPARVPAPELPSAVRLILSRMAAAAALDADDVYPDTVRMRLLYILRLNEAPSGYQAVVRFLSISLRKDDRFAEHEKPYNPGNLRNASVAKFITPADRAILSTVLEQNSHSWALGQNEMALSAEWAVWLIERMARTGRLYWENFRANPPLRVGPARAGRARWVADDEGRQRFTIEPDGDGGKGRWRVLPGMPPLYVDLDRWECGIVTTETPPNMTAALLAAPSLAPGDIAVFRDGAARFAPLLPALPDPPAGSEIRQVAPRPVLRLLSARQTLSPYGGYERSSFYGGIFGAGVAAADLGFDYAGRHVAMDASAPAFQWMEKGALVTIPRDSRMEAAAAARLHESGLRPAEFMLQDADGAAVRRKLFHLAEGRAALAAGWLRFCDAVLPALRAEGWIVEIDPSFPYQLVEAAADWAFDLEDKPGIDWFGVTLGVEVGGERIDLLPILRSVFASLDRFVYDEDDWDDATGGGNEVEAGGPDIDAALRALAPDGRLYVPVGEARFLPLEVERLRPLILVLTELFALRPEEPGLRIGRAHLSDLAALQGAASAAGVPVLGAEAVRRMAGALAEAGGIPAVPSPAGLRATLRPYQQVGLAWLQFLGKHGFGGVLADDMGLGKTVQLLAHLQVEKEAGRLDRPSLLVAPTSVLGNWRTEAARFAPDLRVLVLHGPQRKVDQDGMAGWDLVVTSYALLPRDLAVLSAQPWHLAVFDEAQYLKNPASQAAKAALALEARQRLCLTGTPVENTLDELWSLFSIAVPPLLGGRTDFRRYFRTPIETYADTGRRRLLARRLRPFLLRRTKDEVAAELPAKTEIVETIEPNGAQRDLYETIRLAMDKRVREEIALKGLARSHIAILDALLKLRQVCCDPRLVKLETARRRVATGASSAKLARLMEILAEQLEDGRHILLFSQFTSMLDLIKIELEARGIAFAELTGETRDRETPVRRFQAGEVPLFLISLKAGGTGLNLTAADTVIHYDPWWNPAVEDQATDRAHRIGQDKPVFVYKLVTAGTVEERMRELQDRKRRLGEGIYDRDGAETEALSADDVAFLLAPISGG